MRLQDVLWRVRQAFYLKAEHHSEIHKQLVMRVKPPHAADALDSLREDMKDDIEARSIIEQIILDMIKEQDNKKDGESCTS